MTAQPVALFLDRDGTINTEVDFLRHPDELSLIDGAAEAIREARAAGWRVVVMTNQSGIARGLLTEEMLEAVHDRLRSALRSKGAAVDAIYYCPHHPTAGQPPYNVVCDCRKPLPGMILRGAREFGLDLGRSWVVGDRCVDMEAGRAAGCRTGLVMTGYGATEREECEQRQSVDIVGADLRAVWDRIHRSNHPSKKTNP